MRSFFQNNFARYLLVIILIIFLHYTLILFPVEWLIRTVLGPTQSLLYSVSQNINHGFAELKIKKDLINENQSLQDKINRLEQQLVDLKVFIEENKMISVQSAYLKTKGFDFVTAKIIAKPTEANQNLLLLDKGSAQGIKKGMAVVTGEGILVGRIFETESTTAWALLLVDNQSEISAAVAGQSDIVGLIQGLHNISLKLGSILKNSPIKNGDLIVTSGLDENVPANILIGEVNEITDNAGDLFKSATIDSLANFKNIRLVSVILK